MDQLLFEACSIAEIFKHDRVEPEHVIFALLTKDSVQINLDDCGLDRDEITMTLEAGFGYLRQNSPVEIPRLTISDNVMRALEEAQDDPSSVLRNLISVCPAMNERPVEPQLFHEPLPDLDDLLDIVENERSSLGFDRICEDVFHRQAEVSRQPEKAPSHSPDTSHDEVQTETDRRVSPAPASDKTSLSGKERLEAKRAVERSIRDLTKLFLAGEIDPVIGRDVEIDQICQILMRRRKSNVLLVGEPGVGKTALMEGVAARIATSSDRSLSSRPVLQASLGALVAGARYRGDFEIRMELLVEHALERRAVLFFDEMQMLMGSGATAERGMDGANLLKPVLARDGMSLVGATTNEEAAVIRADPALMRRFETVVVTEPDPELMREILAGAAAPYLAHHDLTADQRILERLIDFADRYLPDRSFPDKAFDLLDMSCVQARLAGQKKIKVDNIRVAVGRLGGTLPAPRLQRNDTSAEKIIARLSEHVGGHPEAVRRLAFLVTEKGSFRPVVAQLDGPAGVGRRTLARALARVLAGTIIELDACQGPERIVSTLQTALKPGLRNVILVNISESLDGGMRDMIRGALSSGYMQTSKGASLDVKSSIFLFRSTSERQKIGFSNNDSFDTFDILDAKKIEMNSFECDRLRCALEFELNRISRIWSDAGESRPIPDVNSILCKMPHHVSSWSEIVRYTSELADVQQQDLL